MCYPLYMCHICVTQFFSKQPKRVKNHINTTPVQIWFLYKLIEYQKTISVPYWYRYGFLSLSFLPYLKSFFKRPVYLFWCPIRFLKYLSWQTNRRRHKNIKKPYLYLRGMDMVFLEIMALRLYFYEIYHINWLHRVPWLLLIYFIQSTFGFYHENQKKKKLKKPYLYQFGIDMVFWRFCLKPTPTGMCCIYMSQMCVPLQKISQKQPKTTKNHIYTTLVQIWSEQK